MTEPSDRNLFRRKHHNNILSILRSLNGDFLREVECHFGGGTAVVLGLDEYRESVDIDFLCASQQGYRKLRQAIWGTTDLSGLLRPLAKLDTLREVRSDQYGIRTIIGVADVSIKFEIIREARISLEGEMDDRFGVPVLTRDCMYAEKLLANADRWMDKAVLNRDILDLSMMISRWGPIPEHAWAIAESAYGDTVRKSYERAIARIRNAEWLRECMVGMAMEPDLEADILAQWGGPLSQEW
jgi:hypothetical protein